MQINNIQYVSTQQWEWRQQQQLKVLFLASKCNENWKKKKLGGGCLLGEKKESNLLDNSSLDPKRKHKMEQRAFVKDMDTFRKYALFLQRCMLNHSVYNMDLKLKIVLV